MKKTVLLIAVSLSVHFYASGQGANCAQTLRLAQSVYDQGRLHELPQLLEGCLANGFTDQEKVNAYKLLTLTYLYLEEPERADHSMLLLLQTDNEYHVNDAVDPAEFVSLYKTFRTTPIFRIGAKVGSIMSQPSVISSEYVNDGESSYKYKFGFNAAITGEIPMTGSLKKFAFNPEIGFQIRSFESSNVQTEPGGEFLNTTVTENQTAILLPLSAQYNFYEKGGSKTVPDKMLYAGLGFAPEYLIAAKQTLISSRGSENSPVEENAFNIISQRNSFNVSAIMSAGFKRKFGKGYLTGELRAQMGLLPMLTEEDQYENQSIISDYKYVDGIFKLNGLSLSVGYIFNKYQPKKLIAD